MENILMEACVESLSEAVQAEKSGAHRLELCSNLDLDGLTPNKKLIKQVVKEVKIPVKVMIRPRSGDFVYSDAETEKMRESIDFCKKNKVKGVVYGILDEENKLNLEQIGFLAELAHPMEVTIHKAIDQTPDILKSISELVQIPTITNVLTSGGKRTAKEGNKTLKEMIRIAGTNLNIIPAGNITRQNLKQIHNLIEAREYHGRRIVG